jgi:hypothetical protein
MSAAAERLNRQSRDIIPDDGMQADAASRVDAALKG